MDEPKLDWSTAEVKDGKLKVSLTGDLPDGWSARFARTVALLNHDNWESVKLKKRGVRVAGLTAGDEDRLRHFLESVVLEASSLPADAEDESSEGEDDETSSVDRAMTDTFQSFTEA